MKKAIKYAVLNENQYFGREVYDIHQLSDDIIFEDINYTFSDYILDRCDNMDIEILENGDIRVGTEYYILINENIILTTIEASQYLGISRPAISYHIKKGNLAVKYNGITAESIEYLKRHKGKGGRPLGSFKSKRTETH